MEEQQRFPGDQRQAAAAARFDWPDARNRARFGGTKLPAQVRPAAGLAAEEARVVSMKRVRLTRSTAGISPTIVTTASFRLHVRHGLRLRILMPRSQTSPGYLSSVSNIARS
jgi:hypothetical protein